MEPVAEDLKERLLAGRVVPFVGAGVSMAVRRADLDKPLFPSWCDLLMAAADFLDRQAQGRDADAIRALLRLDEPDYLDVAERAKRALRGHWPKFLRSQLDPDLNAADDKSFDLARAIWALGSPLVVTTNFDRVLQWTCPSYLKNPWVVEAPAASLQFLREGPDRPTLWHLHGHIDEVEKIILTPESYRGLYPGAEGSAVRYDAALLSLRFLLTSYTLLFIGFSLEDPYFRFQMQWIAKVFPGIIHYALVRRTDVPRIVQSGLPVAPVVYEEHGPPLLELLRELGRIAATGHDRAIVGKKMDALLCHPDATGLAAVLEMLALLRSERVPFEAVLDRLNDLRADVSSRTLFQVSSEIAEEVQGQVRLRQMENARLTEHEGERFVTEHERLERDANQIRNIGYNSRNEISVELVDSFKRTMDELGSRINKLVHDVYGSVGLLERIFQRETIAQRAVDRCAEQLLRSVTDWRNTLDASFEDRLRPLAMGMLDRTRRLGQKAGEHDVPLAELAQPDSLRKYRQTARDRGYGLIVTAPILDQPSRAALQNPPPELVLVVKHALEDLTKRNALALRKVVENCLDELLAIFDNEISSIVTEHKQRRTTILQPRFEERNRQLEIVARRMRTLQGALAQAASEAQARMTTME